MRERNATEERKINGKAFNGAKPTESPSNCSICRVLGCTWLKASLGRV